MQFLGRLFLHGGSDQAGEGLGAVLVKTAAVSLVYIGILRDAFPKNGWHSSFFALKTPVRVHKDAAGSSFFCCEIGFQFLHI